ncbi:GTP-binding tubulin-like cell division protein [Candidatus Desulfarcum epimagneticum]|uniref:Cell division protein FtsZ n=1 Tax=uncultured Desulfobacteraceae bacterium TaxID=218296 RepID=A0A484HPQ3_9BACT|nr:GTP-binding tubulin-like cell division protein [uncultured Desulfobacteraceae bacterium]
MSNFTYVGSDNTAKIKVIGVGGGGGNAVNNMIDSNLQGVKFIAANTDAQAIGISKASVQLRIGEKLTGGLGAGADPNIGREAAIENSDAIKKALEDSHMVFITAGFGGGTGTGATPVIAEICKEIGALTVAVVTKPFSFEGRKRLRQAEEGIQVLKEVTDTVITVPNDRLRGLASKNATMLDMFKKADEVLLHSVRGITDLILMPGLVNLDFADVRSTMSKAGMAIIGIGVAKGENRATEAARKAVSHPLLEDVRVSTAEGVLMNITCGSDLTMEEMTEASECIYNEVGEDTDIIWGTVVDDSLEDEMRVTVIATGIASEDEIQSGGDARKRGRVRDMIPAGPRGQVDYDEPTFIRVRESEEKRGGEPEKIHKGFVDGSDDFASFETPAFLRKKAD